MFRYSYRFSKQLVLILSIIFCFVSTSHADLFKKPIDSFTSKYDIHYKKATKRFFSIGLDYRWFKSQGMAESNLNPFAVSPVSAKGIMQIMDPTRRDLDKKLGTSGNPFDARWSIMAGVYYNSYLYKQWSSPRPELDRLALMFASYNAGLGNILKAQKNCNLYGVEAINECNLWASIKDQGHSVSSWKEEETIGYVSRIFRFMGYNNW